MAEHESDLEFDDLVHQPTRLQLFAYLYRHDGTSFGQLSDDLDLTEGNLSSHLQRMEEAGAVDIEKEFVEKKPRTTAVLTSDGRELLETHIDVLQALTNGLNEHPSSVKLRNRHIAQRSPPQVV